MKTHPCDAPPLVLCAWRVIHRHRSALSEPCFDFELGCTVDHKDICPTYALTAGVSGLADRHEHRSGRLRAGVYRRDYGREHLLEHLPARFHRLHGGAFRLRIVASQHHDHSINR
eukprot:3521509-Rhodomonas_salina.3